MRSWLLVLAFLLGAPTAHAQGRPDVEALRRRVEAIIAGQGVSGAAVALVDRGEVVWAGGVGRTAIGGGRPVDGDTLFRVGSLSKSFLSLAVMRLVEQGRLRLEDRVRDLAPEIAVDNPWERSHPLQLAHLLEHTSGFDEMRFNEIVARDAREDRPLRELLAVNPRSRVARWAPGTRFAYSQPGYTVAGYVLEKVTGLPFEEVMAREVFAPLGVRGAALRATPDARARLATGHEHGRAVGYLPFLHRPAANLMISSAGLGRLLAMALGRGRIDGAAFLSPASVDRIERSGTLPDGAPDVTYGLGNWGDVSQRIPFRGHGGFMPGYAAIYRYSPERGVGYAVLINDSDAWPAMRAINDAILDELVGRGRTQPAPAPLPDPVRYVGYYRLAAPNMEFLRFQSDLYDGVDLLATDSGLAVRWRNRGTRRLVPTATDLFRFPAESGSSVQFVRTADGRRGVWIGRTYYEEASAAWAAARRVALELALLLLASTAVVPLVLVLADEPLRGTKLLVRPLLPALCLLGMSFAFSSARKGGALGTCNLATVAVWLLSWGFALSAHTGLLRALEAVRAPVARWTRAYVVVVSLAAVGLALYLSRYGLIGLRTWRW